MVLYVHWGLFVDVENVAAQLLCFRVKSVDAKPVDLRTGGIKA